MNTIKGIVLSHKGETPGLGAEIATPKHQAQYKGKTIFEGEELVGVTLKKGGADKDNLHEVDAITGGTKTSDGVTAMIKDCLASYKPYFEANKVVAVVAPQNNAPQASQECGDDKGDVEDASETTTTETTPETATVEAASAVEATPEVEQPTKTEEMSNDLNLENNGK